MKNIRFSLWTQTSIMYESYCEMLCCFSYLEQLSGLEGFTHKLLKIPPCQEQSCYNSHEHPREQEAESHTTERHRKSVWMSKCRQVCFIPHPFDGFRDCYYTQTHAMSRLPPVLETHPRVVGEACLSNPRIPHNNPRKLKARISTTIQQRVIQQIHLKTKHYEQRQDHMEDFLPRKQRREREFVKYL